MPGSETLRRMAAAARELPRSFVEDAVDDLEADAVERLEVDTGGDASLSKAPAELSIDVRVSGSSTVVGTAEAVGGPQWTWLEEGTEPHMIGNRAHPGTSGKQTWTEGTGKAMRRLPRDAGDKFTEMFYGA